MSFKSFTITAPFLFGSSYKLKQNKKCLDGTVWLKNNFTEALLKQHSLCQRQSQKISAYRGPDLRFGFEAIIKSLCPTLGRSSILITQNCVHTKHKCWNYPNTLVLIQILLEANNYPLFNLVFDPKYYPISELFLNSDIRSIYSPKFESQAIKKLSL